MKISVVIPVHNEENYIGDLLASLVAQSRSPDEVIVVDSHCTDQTGVVVKSFANQLPVKFIKAVEPRDATNAAHLNVWRVAHARNTGIRRATGDYICFIDADVTLPREHLAEIAKIIAQNDSPKIILSPFRMDNSGKQTVRLGARLMNIYVRLWRRTAYPIGFMCFAVAREISAKIGGFDPALAVSEDFDFIARAHRAGAKTFYAKRTFFEASSRRYDDKTLSRGQSWRNLANEIYRLTHGMKVDKLLFDYPMGGDAAAQQTAKIAKEKSVQTSAKIVQKNSARENSVQKNATQNSANSVQKKPLRENRRLAKFAARPDSLTNLSRQFLSQTFRDNRREYHFLVANPRGAKTLFLLHGISGNKLDMAALATAAAQNGFAVYMPDLPGHGAARAENFAAFDDVGRWFADAVAATKLSPDAIAAHSFGSDIVYDYLALGLAPAKSKIILLSPTLKITKKARFLDLVGARLPEKLAKKLYNSRLVIWLRVRILMVKNTPQIRARSLESEYFKRDFISAHYATAMTNLMLRDQPFAKNLPPKIQRKLTIIYGAGDNVVTRDTPELMRRKCPDARLIVVPDAGHILHFEAVAEFIAALKTA